MASQFDGSCNSLLRPTTEKNVKALHHWTISRASTRFSASKGTKHIYHNGTYWYNQFMVCVYFLISCSTRSHYNGLTIRWFVQQLVHANNRENIESPHHRFILSGMHWLPVPFLEYESVMRNALHFNTSSCKCGIIPTQDDRKYNWSFEWCVWFISYCNMTVWISAGNHFQY